MNAALSAVCSLVCSRKNTVTIQLQRPYREGATVVITQTLSSSRSPSHSRLPCTVQSYLKRTPALAFPSLSSLLVSVALSLLAIFLAPLTCIVQRNSRNSPLLSRSQRTFSFPPAFSLLPVSQSSHLWISQIHGVSASLPAPNTSSAHSPTLSLYPHSPLVFCRGHSIRPFRRFTASDLYFRLIIATHCFSSRCAMRPTATALPVVRASTPL